MFHEIFTGLLLYCPEALAPSMNYLKAYYFNSDSENLPVPDCACDERILVGINRLVEKVRMLEEKKYRPKGLDLILLLLTQRMKP